MGTLCAKCRADMAFFLGKLLILCFFTKKYAKTKLFASSEKIVILEIDPFAGLTMLLLECHSSRPMIIVEIYVLSII